jgi:hypothetical protein
MIETISLLVKMDINLKGITIMNQMEKKKVENILKRKNEDIVDQNLRIENQRILLGGHAQDLVNVPVGDLVQEIAVGAVEAENEMDGEEEGDHVVTVHVTTGIVTGQDMGITGKTEDPGKEIQDMAAIWTLDQLECLRRL